MNKWFLVVAVLGLTNQAMASSEVYSCVNSKQGASLKVIVQQWRIDKVTAQLSVPDENGNPVTENFSGIRNFVLDKLGNTKVFYSMDPTSAAEPVFLKISEAPDFGQGRCGRCANDDLPLDAGLIKPKKNHNAFLQVGEQEYLFQCKLSYE
ncbi:MAG TPA: hypothetical protein VGE46_02605 [Bdellovibrio sp.]